MNGALSILRDERARAVLGALHARAERENLRLGWRFLGQATRLALGRPLPWGRLQSRLSDLSLAVDQASGIFAYQLALALRAQRIVEYGTSHGVSTIYLALAVRENGGGLVIGTECVAEKAARAQANFVEAGVADLIELRVGEAPGTLADLEGPIDLLHNDGFPGAMLSTLQSVAPRMRPGAVALAGNVALFPADHAEYVGWVRDPKNGFSSARLPMRMGGELSVKV